MFLQSSSSSSTSASEEEDKKNNEIIHNEKFDESWNKLGNPDGSVRCDGSHFICKICNVFRSYANFTSFTSHCNSTDHKIASGNQDTINGIEEQIKSNYLYTSKYAESSDIVSIKINNRREFLVLCGCAVKPYKYTGPASIKTHATCQRHENWLKNKFVRFNDLKQKKRQWESDIDNDPDLSKKLESEYKKRYSEQKYITDAIKKQWEDEVHNDPETQKKVETEYKKNYFEKLMDNLN